MAENKKSLLKITLTQRAMLTLIANFFVQGAEFLTGFFITPYIIHGLGQELYGAWGMIQQAISYFAMTDLRSSAALRFLLGLKQHDDNVTTKQQLIGASLLLWALCLPISILIGVGLVLYSPLIIRTSTENQIPVRIAFAVLLTNSAIDRILSIPMNVLRAQNLDYVGMWINSVTVFGGSILSAIAIWLGFGLPGLAVATMINIMLISIGRFIIAKRSIPWLSSLLPSKQDFINFAKTSGWLFLSGMGGLLAFSSEIGRAHV